MEYANIIPHPVPPTSPFAELNFPAPTFLSATASSGDGSSITSQLDASTASKLDAIWASYAGKAAFFIYGPGTFQTTGWYAQQRETIQSNQHHKGSGLDVTILQLVSASNHVVDGVIFNVDGTGVPHGIQNWTCTDMTLDCNGNNQPKSTGAGGFVGAILLPACQNCLVQRVKAIGWGTFVNAGNECFVINAIAQSNQSPQTMTNIVIDSCVFTSPAHGNKDGVTCSGIGDYPPSGISADSTCVISNCTFTNCFSSTPGQPGDFSYQHCYGAPTAFGNSATNCNIGFYIEPGHQVYAGVVIQVYNNKVINCERGAYILCHTGAGFYEIVFNNEYYNLGNPNSGVWISAAGASSPYPTMNSVTVENCTIISQGGNSYGVAINEHGANDFVINELYILNNTLTGYSAPNYLSLDVNPAVLIHQTISGNTEN